MDKLIQFEGTIYEEGYGIVANKIMRSELSLSAKGLYSYLCGYAGNNQKAFPSRIRILSECKISKDTLTKLLKELKEAGLIRVEQERQDKGTFAKNVYYLNNIPCHKIPDTDIPDTVQPDTVKKDTNINTSFKNNNINKNNNNIKSAIEDSTINIDYKTMSEEVWKLYPCKKNKAKAIPKIIAILKDKKKGYDVIVNCIERYKEYVSKKRSNGFSSLEYQNGSTFFNGTYEDYLDENYIIPETKISNDWRNIEC